MEKLEFRKMWADRLKNVKFYERNIKTKRWKTLQQTDDSMLIGFDEDDDFIITYHDGIIKPVAININSTNNCASIFLDGQSSIEIPLEDVFIAIEQFDTVEDEIEMYEITVNEYPAHLDNFTNDFPVFSIETLKVYDTENDIPIHAYKLFVYPSPMELLPIPFNIYKSFRELYACIGRIKRLYDNSALESILTKRGGIIVYDSANPAPIKSYILDSKDQKPELYKVRRSETGYSDITFDMKTIFDIAESNICIDNDTYLYEVDIDDKTGEVSVRNNCDNADYVLVIANTLLYMNSLQIKYCGPALEDELEKERSSLMPIINQLEDHNKKKFDKSNIKIFIRKHSANSSDIVKYEYDVNKFLNI